jgi:hypothetical protein
MARPCKLTPEVQEKIVTAIAAGNAEETAAEYAGIHPATFFRWMAEGRPCRNGGPKGEFYEAVKKAQVQAEVSHVIVIEQAKDKAWQAAAWWLERRHHDRWGRRESVDLTIKREAERIAKETGLDPDEILREAERLVRG